jgi:hypothetical protein
MSGCATVLKGNNDTVSFYSNPEGSSVLIDGDLIGFTPCDVRLDTKHTYKIKITKQGYDTYADILSHSVGSGWVIFDVIFGFFPSFIDMATGSWYELDQKSFDVTLVKLK